MSATFSNAIGWAQFRLLGGWRNLLTTSVGYGLIAATVMLVLVRVSPPPATVTFDYITKFILFIQVLALLVYGTMRAGAAVRTDVRSRMIESHRLMPAPAISAVLGYLFGSTAQAIALFLVNFVAGAVAVSGAALPVRWWLRANAVLLCFSVFLWLIVIFFSFRSPAARTGAVLAIVGMIFPPVHLLLLVLPPVHLLVTPLIGNTIFEARFGIADQELIEAAVVLQALFIMLYVVAAARRYRSDEITAFDPLLALALLTVWLGACAISTVFADRLRLYMGMPLGKANGEATFVTSISLVLLLAILPVSSAVRLAEGEPGSERRRRLAPLLVALAAALLAVQLVHVAPAAGQGQSAVLRTLAVAAAFLVTVRYLLGIAHRLRLRPRQVMFVWLGATWVVPVAIELMLMSVEPRPDLYHMSQVGMCSPVGELYQIWSRDPHVHSTAFSGLAVQIGMALLFCAVYHLLPKHKGDALTAPVVAPAAP